MSNRLAMQAANPMACNKNITWFGPLDCGLDSVFNCLKGTGIGREQAFHATKDFQVIENTRYLSFFMS